MCARPQPVLARRHFPQERASPRLVHALSPSAHGILQARILEELAIPSAGDLPNPGIEPGSPALQADSLLSEPWESSLCRYNRCL